MKQLIRENKKVKEFLQSLGDVEYESGTFVDYEHNLSGYSYDGQYWDIDFTFYIPSESDNDIYLKTKLKNSDDAQKFLLNLSKIFGVNLDKLRFSKIRFDVFKIQTLPDELINLSTDNCVLYLSSKNNRIFLSIEDKISLEFDQETKKVIISEIGDWETYKKIRSVLDDDVREILDKLSSSKPEFRLKTMNGRLTGLEGEWKEKVLKLLNKLTPFFEKIKKIIITDNSVLINGVLLVLKDDNWEVEIPINELQKLLDQAITMELHKDFWIITVYRDELPNLTNVLNIETEYIITPEKISPYFDKTERYYVFKHPNEKYNDYYNLVTSENLEKYLQSLGINISQQTTNTDSFEISGNNYKYSIIRGEKDEIHVKIYKENKFMTSLKTYLWYFSVRDFDELKKLEKEKIISIIDKQLKEEYFYPIPFDRVKQYTETLLNNIIHLIDVTIDEVITGNPDFTSSIKTVVSIACIFDKDCKVWFEPEYDFGQIDVYYYLIGTSEGHLPVPIVFDYLETPRQLSDKERINIIKNFLYLARGYENVSEIEREVGEYEDNVRTTSSLLFQEAIVLYNKLVKGKYDEIESHCPDGTLSDGIGYCRKFDYKELMRKSVEELRNNILASLIETRKKITKIKEKMSKSVFFPVLNEEGS